jgi:hypothetical protein
MYTATGTNIYIQGLLSVSPLCFNISSHTLKRRRMTTHHTEAVSAVWFLYSEANEPLGQLYRREAEAVPTIGDQVTDDKGRWQTAEIVEVKELGPTCAMRRFRVVIRITV